MRPVIDIYVPSKTPLDKALSRTTHLAVGAHADDLEIMAYHGILECYSSKINWFTGVVVTDGAGSARGPKYKKLSETKMIELRKREQFKAAQLGKYSAVIQLGYKSSEIKTASPEALIEDLKDIFLQTKPKTVYLHNLADKHDTHVACSLTAIKALRAIDYKPEKVYGCEVWRGLDWLLDKDKVLLPVSKNPVLAKKLLGVFKSQISGGKRYDLASLGRRNANATFSDAKTLDKEVSVIYAMDLTPLIINPSLSVDNFVGNLLEDFKKDIFAKLGAYG